MTENPQMDNSKTESHKMTVGFWSLCFGLLVALDLVTKYLAHKLSWPIFYNYNFAFSIPMPVPLMFSVYAVVLLFTIYFLIASLTQSDRRLTFGWLMILAGGVSNIGERIVFGSVTDFIYILNGVFNLADFLVLLGLLIVLLRYKK